MPPFLLLQQSGPHRPWLVGKTEKCFEVILTVSEYNSLIGIPLRKRSLQRPIIFFKDVPTQPES